MKYIVVTGGVVSGLGKGITISSIGVLLKACGLRVTSIKIDPYLNTDAGTMSPFEHGEVFVLNDGGEVDLDLGNYERFLNIKLTRDHNITTGKIYSHVIRRERRGDYLGKTVQVVPHVTDAVQEWIERVAQIPTDSYSSLPPDVCLIEVGGTVGDLESGIFLEALRQFQFRAGADNFALVHVSLVPTLGSVGEQKTKPTQHTVKELRSLGLSPHLLVCRSDAELEKETTKKLAMFCHVALEHVIAVHNVSNIYNVPLLLAKQNVAEELCKALKLTPKFASPQLEKWAALAHSLENPKNPAIKIAIVGKYTGLQDAYLSLIRSLNHCEIQTGRQVKVVWVEAAHLEDGTPPDESQKAWSALKSVNGVIVPGGFGVRGFLGKVNAVKYCREEKVPFLGICLGMHAVCVEAARNLLNIPDAHSQEFDQHTKHHAIVFMPEFSATEMGGTMRLGARTTSLLSLPTGERSLAQDMYGRVERISERHRHRYEVNPSMVGDFEKVGLLFTGRDFGSQAGAEPRMEIAELARDKHPFFWCCQFHPELQSFPHSPSPPFWALVQASAGVLSESLPFPVDRERGVFPGVTPGMRAGTPPLTPSLSPFPPPSIVPQEIHQQEMPKLNLEVKNAAADETSVAGVKRKFEE